MLFESCRLAKRLGLSRTSFYWFFEDREQLLAALLSALARTKYGELDPAM